MDKFQMPPPITSLFDRNVRKGISQDEFVIIDGRVMLPQESVAKFFDMSVRDVTLAVPFIQQRARSTLGIVRRDGKFYFSTGESMIEMYLVSPYRNTETDFSFFYRLFDETQEDLVTNKLYYEPERKPPKNKSSGSKIFYLILIMLVWLFFVQGNNLNKPFPPSTPKSVVVEQKTDQSTSMSTKVESQQPTTPIETQQPTEMPKPAPSFVPTSRFKGRGNDSYADKEYVGTWGFIGIYYDQDSELYRDCTPPWYIKTYERDKQLWVESEIPIEHKTQVVVLQTFLKPARYFHFEGYLLVKRLSDDEQFYINVKNFITDPYWEKQDLVQAAKGGKFLVEYHQRSNYWPVDEDNHKRVPPEGSILLVTDINTGTGKISKDNNQIWASGNEFRGACFNKEDLTIVY